MQKIKIENRKEQNIAVIIEENPQATGLAFVMHGLGGFKEQPHVAIMAKSFAEAGYTVVRFDTTNTLGESDGDYADATVTNYYQDLEDVVAWAKSQVWYQEPFCLAGHSLGAICVTLFAEKFSKSILGLAPTSIILSQESFVGVVEDWRRDGYIGSRDGYKINNVPLKQGGKLFEDDLQKYDVTLNINNLKMPVLLVAGSKDELLKQNEIFYDKLMTEKELHIIKNAPHTFREAEHLAELKNIFDNWLKKIT
jgi:alpha/beta superfamily hydrolase